MAVWLLMDGKAVHAAAAQNLHSIHQNQVLYCFSTVVNKALCAAVKAVRFVFLKINVPIFFLAYTVLYFLTVVMNWCITHRPQVLPLFFQGCRQHRAVQRDGLHSERAVQPALGASPAAAQTPALDRSQRGGRSLLQLGLQAAQPSTHRLSAWAQVREMWCGVSNPESLHWLYKTASPL